MDSSKFLGITTFVYLFSSMIYMVMFLFRVKRIGLLASIVTFIGFLLNTIGIGLRWYESYQMGIGHAPLSNMYESLVFFAWSIIIFYLIMEFIYKNRVIGVFVVPFAFASMAYASISAEFGKEITPLLPALQSNWLVAHVITCFVAYAAFAIACGTGIMYLVKMRDKNDQKSLLATLPSLEILDDITHKVILFGFIWLSIGIITGAVWANSAWGTYWSWDPKQTWSVIAWFIYATILHARFTRDWGGKRIAWFAILGFISILFTYYGVNFFLKGLHSYAV